MHLLQSYSHPLGEVGRWSGHAWWLGTAASGMGSDVNLSPHMLNHIHGCCIVFSCCGAAYGLDLSTMSRRHGVDISTQTVQVFLNLP